MNEEHVPPIKLLFFGYNKRLTISFDPIWQLSTRHLFLQQLVEEHLKIHLHSLYHFLC
ncbi:hypothetical protein LINPERPRIM_LOCUS9453, partial [Linum perenne]